ncbi:MAG TPA: phosphate ABC transporter permease subunit PstC [Stellaceae bacterium]|nr:phosphate ABC transporter permease subunit PstC [Stellaceae bacterium]
MTIEPAARVDPRFANLARASSLRPRDWFASKVFNGALALACLLFVAVMGGLVLQLLWGARLSIQKFGVGFLWSSAWNPVTSQFGALPFIYGTVVSSLIALVLASSVGILGGIYLAEFAPRRLALSLSMLIELLAAVPSIVYGLWGLFVLAPVVSTWIGPALQSAFGFLPIFQGTIYGVNMLTAALILALMVVPTITAITRDLIAMIQARYREASLALGATKWETVTKIILPFAYRGIFGACILGLGRALGETIATTMVIGNRPAISASLFAPGYTVASVIANEFTEATTDIYLSSLIELGLLLFFVSVIVIGVGRFMVRFLLRSNEA